MKVLGCVIFVLGVLLGAVSIALFGMAVSRAMDARQVRTFPLEMGSKRQSDVITVDTSKFCMIALKAKVTSTSVKKETGKFDKYDLQFSFPFRYSVFDAGGKVLITEDTRFAHDKGARTYHNTHVTENGGTAEVESGYDKFSVPGSGQIRVEAEIHSDESGEAAAQDLNLIVYDHVSKHARSVTAGALLLVLGAGLAVGGAALFIVGMMRSR